MIVTNAATLSEYTVCASVYSNLEGVIESVIERASSTDNKDSTDATYLGMCSLRRSIFHGCAAATHFHGHVRLRISWLVASNELLKKTSCFRVEFALMTVFHSSVIRIRLKSPVITVHSLFEKFAAVG